MLTFSPSRRLMALDPAISSLDEMLPCMYSALLAAVRWVELFRLVRTSFLCSLPAREASSRLDSRLASSSSILASCGALIGSWGLGVRCLPLLLRLMFSFSPSRDDLGRLADSLWALLRPFLTGSRSLPWS